MAPGCSVRHDGRTKRQHAHARAIPIRRAGTHRPGRRLNTPFVALLLSSLAFLSPALTLAPIQAVEPLPPRGAQPIDALEKRPALNRPHLLDLQRPTPRPAPDPTSAAGPAVGTTPRPTPAPTPVPDPAVLYQAAIEAARTAGAAHGITFAVVRDGELVWAGSSGRARDGRTELQPGTPLVIGSVTKTFVAAVVLQLASEDKIDLSDPVRRHLPDLDVLSSRVTIAQLLDHTSGLADVFNDTTRVGLEEDPAHAWTAPELLKTLHEPWYAPGVGWAYANTNYYLLGLLVERVTGNALGDELERRMLTPLSLASTGMVDAADAASPLAPAWSTIFWASGAMTSSAADVARWGDALYRGNVLPGAARDAMLDFNSHDYGFGVQRIELAGTRGYGHTGLLNTYTTLLLHVPTEDVTISLLVNRSHVDLGAMLRARPGDGPSLLELALGE